MCLFPTTCTQDPDTGKAKPDPEGHLKLPCGKCDECIALRASDWALRAQHEASLHKNNTFITLTYDQENLPSIFVVKEKFQKFMKLLRWHIYPQKINYIVSHEYGSQTFRPHHHVMIFGYDPDDQEYLRTTKKGYPLFTSNFISTIWKHGFHSIGEANAKTAYYIAAYALKGKTHDLLDPITGEYVKVNDSFDCSKRPGIGLNYFKQNYQQLLNSDSRLPRYYVKKLQELHPDLHEEYENKTNQKIQTRSSHQVYAKFKLTNTLKYINNSEFRNNPQLNSKTDIQNKEHLYTNVKNYTEHLRSKETK